MAQLVERPTAGSIPQCFKGFFSQSASSADPLTVSVQPLWATITKLFSFCIFRFAFIDKAGDFFLSLSVFLFVCFSFFFFFWGGCLFFGVAEVKCDFDSSPYPVLVFGTIDAGLCTGAQGSPSPPATLVK